MEFDGGCYGTFTAFQAAAGSENDIRLRVYGELRVAMQGEAARVVARGDADLPPEILALGRAPRGHPEGLLQAFANLYGEVAQERMAIALGDARPAFPYPRIEDGAHSMAFIEACLASKAAGTWVDVERP